MNVAATKAGSDATAGEWSPARVYLAVAAVYLLILGAAGFLYDASFPTSAGAVGHSHIFGIFETNGWHNLAGLVFGVIALIALLDPARARVGALIVALPNLGVFIVFALVDPRTFWFASNGIDNVTHALLGFGGVVAVLATRSRAS
jgi:uncharacterized protein DUF4383